MSDSIAQLLRLIDNEPLGGGSVCLQTFDDFTGQLQCRVIVIGVFKSYGKCLQFRFKTGQRRWRARKSVPGNALQDDAGNAAPYGAGFSTGFE